MTESPAEARLLLIDDEDVTRQVVIELLKALGYVEARFHLLYAKLQRLAQAGRAPGREEMTLLDGFHAEEPEEGVKAPAAAKPLAEREAGEERAPAFGVAALFGRPGLPRRILESKLAQRLRSP